MQRENTQLDNQLRAIMLGVAEAGIDSGGPTPLQMLLMDEGANGIATVVAGLLQAVTMIQTSAGQHAMVDSLDTLFSAAFVLGFEVGHEFQRRGYALPEPESVG